MKITLAWSKTDAQDAIAKKMINFRPKKIHYLGGFFAQLFIHTSVIAGLFFAAYFSLTLWKWWPIIAWLIFTLIIDSLLWYDTFRGWKKKQ